MARHHPRVVWTLPILFALCSVHGAWAGPPTDQLRTGVDRVITILRDPGLEGEKQVIPRRAAISKVAAEIFDFSEMAKRSLGQHWDRRTASERGEFVRLLTALIERSYISKVDRPEAVTTMTYRSETVDGDYAVVQAMIPLPHDDTMPLGYHMRSTSGRWQVYDLDIDGVSLIANYRAQFNKIIRTSSYEELVAKLKSNQAEFSAPSTAPSGGKAAR
jgi:phospholipid transport system substrate-binding protein